MLFNATSDYWWFLKDGDNSKMIIFDTVGGQWTYVGRTGADFSSVMIRRWVPTWLKHKLLLQ